MVGDPRYEGDLDFDLETSPRDGVFYFYRWGCRSLERTGPIEAVAIWPAALVPPDVDPDLPEGGLMELSSLQEAKLYSAELGGKARLVIALRVMDGDQNPLLKLERADYLGYLHTLSYASSLTGVSFDNMASPRGQGQPVEEPLPLKVLVRKLRRARKAGDDINAELLARQVDVDFKHRHDRNHRT